jgi:hypothetical protein
MAVGILPNVPAALSIQQQSEFVAPVRQVPGAAM